MILMGPYQPFGTTQVGAGAGRLGEWYNGKTPEEHERLLREESVGFPGSIAGGWNTVEDATIRYVGKGLDSLAQFNEVAREHQHAWLFTKGTLVHKQTPSGNGAGAGWLRKNWLWLVLGVAVIGGGVLVYKNQARVRRLIRGRA